MPPRPLSRPDAAGEGELTIRILGGQWEGRAIGVPTGVRPMTEMVKQALFHVLGDVSGLNVLDLFGGSGQLGLEGLSRGAVFAAFVEKENRNADHIRSALKELGVSAVSARVLTLDALKYIGQTNSSFDLIFVDPPYEMNLAGPCLSAVSNHDTLLAPGGRIVLRHTKHEPVEEPPADRLTSEFTRRYGDDIVRIWRRPN